MEEKDMKSMDEKKAEGQFIKFVNENNQDLLYSESRILYDELLKRYIQYYKAGSFVNCSVEKINEKFIKTIFFGWQRFIKGKDY